MAYERKSALQDAVREMGEESAAIIKALAELTPMDMADDPVQAQQDAAALIMRARRLRMRMAMHAKKGRP